MIEIKALSGGVIATLDIDSLSGADLQKTDLQGAELQGADLQRADLRGADLRGADLRGANLRYSNLREVDLRSSDLRYADLRYADLRYADLNRTNISCSEISGCVGNGREIKTIIASDRVVTWTKHDLAIGCKQFSFICWMEMSYEEIFRLDRMAKHFYENEWPYIKLIVMRDYESNR